MSAEIIVADVRDGLATLADQSVQCVVTSPPYWALRDYGVDGQIGQEATPDEYVATIADVFRGVRRVLRDDGTLWLNLGDTFAHDKNLIGIPWRVAFALQADGWYLRSDIIWAKPNPMPESVTDRPTKAHEYLFLMTKQPRYYYDAAAIAEPLADSSVERLSQPTLELQAGSLRANGGAKSNGAMKAVRGSYKGSTFHRGKTAAHQLGRMSAADRIEGDTRNKRTVWTIATQSFSGAHFATFPEALVEPCILAGSREADVVLDPFAGSGTVGVVALRHNRRFVGIELNYEYAEMARRRITGDAPLLNETTLIGGAA